VDPKSQTEDRKTQAVIQILRQARREESVWNYSVAEPRNKSESLELKAEAIRRKLFLSLSLRPKPKKETQEFNSYQ
jgi:hypothetical protein